MRPDDGRVVSNFILQALRQEPLTVYGEGQQTRSFCYVSDLVEAIFQMMQTPDEFTGPVNLGNPSEWTMLQLAEKVLALTESNSSIDFLPLPQDDPKMRLPVISLAEKMLQWKPRVPLEEGLKNTIEYFKAL
jgi:UDP-glucuronate decarboxylase